MSSLFVNTILCIKGQNTQADRDIKIIAIGAKILVVASLNK